MSAHDEDAHARRVNLSALRRVDPAITGILAQAAHVVVYQYAGSAWAKKDVEGTMFVYERSSGPRWGFYIMNRLDVVNVNQFIVPGLQIHPDDETYLLYQTPTGDIMGLWFHDPAERQALTIVLMRISAQAAAAAIQPAQPAPAQPAQPAPAQAQAQPAPLDGNGLLRMLQGPSAAAPAVASSTPSGQSGGNTLQSLFQQAATNRQAAAPAASTPQPQPGSPTATAPQVSGCAVTSTDSPATAESSNLASLLQSAFGSRPAPPIDGSALAAPRSVSLPASPAVRGHPPAQQPPHQPAQPQPQQLAPRPTPYAHMLQRPGGPSASATPAAPGAAPPPAADSLRAAHALLQSMNAAPAKAAHGPEPSHPSPTSSQAQPSPAPPAAAGGAAPMEACLRRLIEAQRVRAGRAPVNPLELLSVQYAEKKKSNPKAMTKSQLQKMLAHMLQNDAELMEALYGQYRQLFAASSP